MNLPRLLRWLLGGLIALVLVVVVNGFAGYYPAFGAVVTHVPFGWWAFLRRNLPQLTWSWSLVLTGVVCSAAVMLIGHRLLQALIAPAGQRQSGSPSGPTRRWRWRWTASLYVALWLLFAIAFGATGVLRHTTWLMAYDGPWYQERLYPQRELRFADFQLREVLMENNGDLDATRRAFPAKRQYRARRALLSEEFDALFYGDGSNHVTAYLIIPRNPELLVKGKFALSTPDGEHSLKPLSELPQTIAELDAAYPSGGQDHEQLETR
jgi:hypothetical protein